MTPERLRECLGVLNWSIAALAAMAQISPVTARRWLNGQREIPSKVAGRHAGDGDRSGRTLFR